MKDSQQQTYVTKHDLELLHKKIIATDLIVQKYQDANRALLRLQGENDDLRQQVEQITNECCIFSKQVTECTQECDILKEQISILIREKREIEHQLRLLQDENTNNYHEIMVLKQYESLKEINDQLSKTVDRQQKNLAKLQLQVQRKSPVTYKPNKINKEPSETDIALVNSQKSVRELKLALGRLVYFIQTSNIEIPTALNIRPVLKAHDISDNIVEIDGEFFIRKPVKKTRKPIVSQTTVEEKKNDNDDDDDDDDDDDNGDFVDVTHPVKTSTVNTTTPSDDKVEETPTTSKTASRQQQKAKKSKSTKTRRHNAPSISEDLANKLEFALSQADQPEPISQISSFFSDDDNEDKLHKSVEQQLSKRAHSPIISPSSTIYPKTNSSITIIPKTSQPISKSISFLSDDDNEDISQQKLPPISSLIEQQPSFIPMQTHSFLQVDSITPVEYELTDKPTKYMSFLSDDDDMKSLSSTSTPVTPQPSSIHQEYISPLRFPDLTVKINDDINNTPESPLTPVVSTGIQQQPLLLSPEDPVLLTEDHHTSSTIPTQTLNPNHIKIVLRLLDILTNTPPPPMKPLRLDRRRIQRKKISETEPADQNTTAPVIENIEYVVSKSTEPTSIIADNTTKTITLTPTEEQPKVIEEKLVDLEPMEDSHNVSVEVPEPMEVLAESVNELCTNLNVITTEESVDNRKEMIHETVEDHVPILHEQQERSIDENLDRRKTDETNRDVVEKYTAVLNKSSTILKPQESTPLIGSIQFKQPLPPPPRPSSISKVPKKSPLKPFQISIITRLVNVLTTLPVKPLTLPSSFPARKPKQTTIVNKTPVTLSRQTSNPISHSPVRMHTRSMNSIRACIARCNQPAANTRKRTATTASLASTSSSTSPPKVSKRMKSMKAESSTNEYDIIHKFLNSFTKQIHNELNQMIEQKLQEDTSLFHDNIYRIVHELMINKCDIILPLVKKLHPYEESIQVLLTYINSKSSTFQKQFIMKLNQTFEYEMKHQQQTTHNCIKILNRLFFLCCSIFTLSSTVTIYARLFDIGYHLPQDILIDALSFISNVCSSLISIDSQTNSSNVLFHQIIFDIFKENQVKISLEYLENLLIAYHRYTHDREDLLRCFVLISRYQKWLWCTNELCMKLLFPLLTRIDDQYQQRETVLMILQYVLFLYKENEDFQHDSIFHDQTKQLLSSLKTLNSDECIVRDKIFFIFHTYCQINK